MATYAARAGAEPPKPVEPVLPEPLAEKQVRPPKLAGWPLAPDEARALQAGAGEKVRRTIDLGDGLAMDLVWIPAGQFVTDHYRIEKLVDMWVYGPDYLLVSYQWHPNNYSYELVEYAFGPAPDWLAAASR